MKIRSAIPLAICAITGGVFSSCKHSTTAHKDERPNLVLIVADDHGRDDTGAFGNEAIHTPNLDLLAQEGIRMNRAYCTSASCSASRSVILSGLYNHANGQYGHAHGPAHFSAFDDVRSLPVLLEETGYRTARIGKYHVAPEKVFHFQEVLPAPQMRNPVAMADACLEFIRTSEGPFFLYYATVDPHRGGGIDASVGTGPDRFGNRDEGYEGVVRRTFTRDDVIVPDYLPDTPECRDELAQYYQSVDRLDQGVGRLIQHLKETGKWENTLIMYISDNGIAFPGAKTNLYDPGMRLPCIIKLPGNRQAGTESDAMINWASIAPTFLDYAGAIEGGNKIPGGGDLSTGPDPGTIPKFSNFHEKSFRAAIEKGVTDGFNDVYASHTFHELTMYYPMRVYQDRQYKLIFNIASGLPYPHASDLWASSTWQSALESGTGMYAKRGIEAYTYRDRFELYDMHNDPDEIINLASDPAYQDILKKMQEKLQEFMIRTSDPWSVKWEHE